MRSPRSENLPELWFADAPGGSPRRHGGGGNSGLFLVDDRFGWVIGRHVMAPAETINASFGGHLFVMASVLKGNGAGLPGSLRRQSVDRASVFDAGPATPVRVQVGGETLLGQRWVYPASEHADEPSSYQALLPIAGGLWVSALFPAQLERDLEFVWTVDYDLS